MTFHQFFSTTTNNNINNGIFLVFSSSHFLWRISQAISEERNRREFSPEWNLQAPTLQLTTRGYDSTRLSLRRKSPPPPQPPRRWILGRHKGKRV